MSDTQPLARIAIYRDQGIPQDTPVVYSIDLVKNGEEKTLFDCVIMQSKDTSSIKYKGSADKQICQRLSPSFASRPLSKTSKALPNPYEEILSSKPDRLAILGTTLLFKIAEPNLNKQAPAILASVVTMLQGRDQKCIVVEAHIDNVGSTQHNQKLSLERAETIKTYLSKQMPNRCFEAKGMGSSQPLASNEKSDGRDVNRRIEIYPK